MRELPLISASPLLMEIGRHKVGISYKEGETGCLIRIEDKTACKMLSVPWGKVIYIYKYMD
jgi:hypothetical protein